MIMFLYENIYDVGWKPFLCHLLGPYSTCKTWAFQGPKELWVELGLFSHAILFFLGF